MKVLKHRFEIERAGVRDGEIVELDSEFIDCNFSLTLKATELFEQEYGKPIINVLFGGQDDTTSGSFIRALACSTYLDIKDNKIVQNEATKDAFKNMEIYSSIASDLQFVTDLTAHAIECVEVRTKKSMENNKRSKN